MNKKILILNWRDPQSPMEGGAERFTKKYAQYWSSLGHEVSWVTNSFPGSSNSEVINSVSYIRIGPSLSGSLLSYLFNYPIFLLKTLFFVKKFVESNKIDLIIDEIHGMPFFTPLFFSTKKILLVCEVAGTIWDKMFPFPINVIGKNIEKFVYSFYKHTQIWAISENTKKNILEILPKAKVEVIDLGAEVNNKLISSLSKKPKFDYPSAVFLARIVKMKGVETAIEATSQIIKKEPKFKLLIIGSGDEKYIKFLKNKVKKLKITNNIKFLGYLSEECKLEYLAKAHFLFHPSYKEGFGLTLIEAGLVGTPAIIRSGSSMDSLIDYGMSGFSFDKQEDISKIFLENYNSKNYANLRKSAKKKAEHYLWERVLRRSNKITGI